MNKGILLSAALVFVAVFSSACSDKLKIDDSDTYVFGQDSQENCISHQSNAYLAESKDSYYYTNRKNRFIYVIDKTSGVCMPLCNKSDCMHDKETIGGKRESCNAYLGVNAYNIIYYNDSIYYTNSRQEKDKDGNIHFIEEIFKMSLDGTKREAIYSTEEYTIWNFKIHRGYIYAEMTKIGSDGADGSDAALYKMSVSDIDDCSELLPYYKYQDINGLWVLDTRFYGNHIFLLLGIFYDNNKSVNLFVRYDLKTNEYEMLNEKVNQSDIYYFTVFNDKLVYSCNKEIYKCDFNGEDNELIADFSDMKFAEFKDYRYFNPLTNDGKYFIVTAAKEDAETSNKVIMCDKDNNVTISTLDFPAYITTGCDEVSMVKQSEDESKLYFLKKSDGNVTAKEIYSFE